MAAAKLNPEAEEWKPPTEKGLMHCRPLLLPHQIYHSIPPVPVGIPTSQSFSLPQNCFFLYQQQQQQQQQQLSPPLGGVPFQWIHTYHIASDQSCFATGYEVLNVGMKKGKLASAFSRTEGEKRGQNKKPFLPPRLRAAETERGRQKPSFGMKKRLNNTDSGFLSSYKSSAPVENPSFSCNKTTVMIRNIPNQFSREPFMRFIDHFCLENHWEYDFLYLPIDFGTENNLGYAFVNFTTGCAASGIGKVLKKFKWEGIKTPVGIFASKKICEVTWARIQGKEELVKHFSTSKFICDTNEYLPVVFSPPRNGSTSLTKPVAIGKLAGSSVSPTPSA